MVVTADDLEHELQEEFARKLKATSTTTDVSWVPHRCRLLLATGIFCAVLMLALPQPAHWLSQEDLVPLPGQISALTANGSLSSDVAVPRLQEKMRPAAKHSSGAAKDSTNDDTHTNKKKQDADDDNDGNNDEEKEDEEVFEGADPGKGLEAGSRKGEVEDKHQAGNDGGQSDGLCLVGHAYHRGKMVNDNAGPENGRECLRACQKQPDCNFWDHGNGYCRLRSDSGGAPVDAAGYIGGPRDCHFKSADSSVANARFISCPA